MNFYDLCKLFCSVPLDEPHVHTWISHILIAAVLEKVDVHAAMHHCTIMVHFWFGSYKIAKNWPPLSAKCPHWLNPLVRADTP